MANREYLRGWREGAQWLYVLTLMPTLDGVPVEEIALREMEDSADDFLSGRMDWRGLGYMQAILSGFGR